MQKLKPFVCDYLSGGPRRKKSIALIPDRTCCQAASSELPTTVKHHQRPSASFRRGFALKELVLVMSAIGSGVIVIKSIDPISDERELPLLVRLRY